MNSMEYCILTELTEETARQLAVIEEESFSHPLTKRQILSLTESQNAHYIIARDGEKTVGSVWVQIVRDEGYIGNVAVLPAHRRRGIADGLLLRLSEFAGEKQLSFLTLEVRASNHAAIALYEKNGFSVAGRRPNYYSEPKEDAILMTLRFI